MSNNSSQYTISFNSGLIPTALEHGYKWLMVRQTCYRSANDDYTHNDSERLQLRAETQSYLLTTNQCKESDHGRGVAQQFEVKLYQSRDGDNDVHTGGINMDDRRVTRGGNPHHPTVTITLSEWSDFS